ncbi:YdhK family protein [Bacillus sp. CGMCC 1.16541]|uniref:YdhK family protein n=1 Tax=Bacillus sp. CGMCC 1.16541 TaxID=2185143 RepID=UPI000D73A87D|nr:YdhK family protein [Bacillus sp. CGMCC 1.16541]
MNKKLTLAMTSAFLAFALTACGGNNENTQEPNSEEQPSSEESMEEGHEGHEGMDHSGMDHSSSGEVPEGLKEAENPTYPVGSQAMIEKGHMKGMEGVEATIVGAYDTVAYVVSYDPTNGGERVKDHKWIVHEEIKDAGDKPFEQGEEVTLEANHMEGMNGAKATIESAEETTVYMIDYTSTDGEEVKNHQWVTESELSAKE